EEQVRLYTDNAPAMLTYIDADRRLRFANRAYLEFVGSDRDAVLGQQLDDVLSPGEFLKRREYIDGALSGDRQEFEIEVESADGVTSYALGTYLPDRDPVSGSVRGVFAVLQDITSRRRAEVALQEVNETLEQRVVQRTGELQEAKAEAEEANRAKSRFLAAASHDLLQPLNAARLFASVLSQHTTEMEARHAELVSRVDSSLTAAEELLSALLDISKLDRGVLRPAEEVFAVAELLERLSTQFAPLMRENGLEFRVRPTDAVIRSDRQMLRRIVQNFLANAFRYTPSGGILLGCRVRGDCLRIAVWDTGPGISDDERERIFDEFHREDRDHVRGQQGLGLGLAIARRMAATLGLEIGLASRPAHGSCFWVDVPLAEATVVTAAPVAGSPERPTGDFDGLRVLCVENDESIQEGMLALLERWGCDARAAADVTGCHTAMADGFRPEVILLDFHLDHGWSGLDVLDALGSKVERVPTVLITADRSEELQAEAVRRGIRMLRKPLRPAKLRRLLTGISRPEIAES
ncbi:MAG: PAS domain-containing hybrid sensor histidine kinase/response regulator, partial [Pseudomonadota bacterium]